MKYTFNFEKLRVWNSSKDLAVFIYKSTSNFPNSHRFNLSSQLESSAISISSNIAEGNSRKGKADKLKFFNIAYSSLMEMMSQSNIAFELKLISVTDFEQIRTQSIAISNMLIALIAKTENNN